MEICMWSDTYARAHVCASVRVMCARVVVCVWWGGAGRWMDECRRSDGCRRPFGPSFDSGSPGALPRSPRALPAKGTDASSEASSGRAPGEPERAPGEPVATDRPADHQQSLDLRFPSFNLRPSVRDQPWLPTAGDGWPMRFAFHLSHHLTLTPHISHATCALTQRPTLGYGKNRLSKKRVRKRYTRGLYTVCARLVPSLRASFGSPKINFSLKSCPRNPPRKIFMFWPRPWGHGFCLEGIEKMVFGMFLRGGPRPLKHGF